MNEDGVAVTGVIEQGQELGTLGVFTAGFIGEGLVEAEPFKLPLEDSGRRRRSGRSRGFFRSFCHYSNRNAVKGACGARRRPAAHYAASAGGHHGA